MLELTLDELKTYLRVDGSEDDGFLALLIDAAKEFLLHAGVSESNSKLYKLAVMMHVSSQYDRDPKMSDALQTIILQLKA